MSETKESAYDAYVKARTAEEDAFRANRGDYVLYRMAGKPYGSCTESEPGMGRCDRTDDHYTHEARGGAGNILGRWRVRKLIEKVDPNIQLPE